MFKKLIRAIPRVNTVQLRRFAFDFESLPKGGADQHEISAYPDHGPPMTITFRTLADNKEYVCKDAYEGEYLFDVAKRHGVPVVTRCGGFDVHERNFGPGSSCKSCLCMLSLEHVDKVVPPEETEEFILLNNVPNLRPNHRLGCSVELSQELDGLVVAIPAEEIDDPAMDNFLHYDTDIPRH